MYIIVDTEYTTWDGALESGWTLPNQHREIVQLAAIKLDANFKEMEHLDILVKPTINPELSSLFLNLTNLKQIDVDTKGVSFQKAINDFLGFTNEGILPVICMNADEAVFRENCKINDINFPFPSSWHRLRPFLEATGIDMSNLSSGDLHSLTQSPIKGHTHNALHDVRSMGVWLKHAFLNNKITNLSELPTGAPKTDPRSKKFIK